MSKDDDPTQELPSQIPAGDILYLINRKIEENAKASSNDLLRGVMFESLQLRSVESKPLGVVPKTSHTSWKVTSKADSQGAHITVVTSYGLVTGKIGGDIQAGSDDDDQATKIAAFFNGKGGVVAVASGAVVNFSTVAYVAPIGSLVYSSHNVQESYTGFEPEYEYNNSEGRSAFVPRLEFANNPDDIDRLARMRQGDYMRLKQVPGTTTTSVGKRELPESPYLKDGRMRILKKEFLESPDRNHVYLDKFPATMRGGELMYMENDNVISPSFGPRNKRGYRWMVSKKNAPAEVWETPVPVSGGRKSFSLRCSEDVLIDLWVW